ncbi:Urea ABC transporter, ATPase protein UrtE (fragment) [Paraburkholderia piptadeniae]|uniref:Urea ABC transporter, ATPase protein UrtE n=1 Tax=Paraburkholderia piptadeniae TaxID=1701573 RepID=A0A1N7SWI1_9BURK
MNRRKAFIGRTVRQLVEEMCLAVLLVEQYYDFTQAIANRYWVTSRGEIIAGSEGVDMDRDGLRSLIVV